MSSLELNITLITLCIQCLNTFFVHKRSPRHFVMKKIDNTTPRSFGFSSFSPILIDTSLCPL